MAGNTSASSLLKAGSSIANQIAEYNDKFASNTYDNSQKNDADFQVYQQYLSGRIATLNTSPSISSASKALSLSISLKSANRSYVSNTIQRISQGIIEGTQTPIDKEHALIEQYNRAQANGDDNLAQNIRGQYDSLNQQIQYDQKVGAAAAKTQADANATAQEKGFEDAISAFDNAGKIFAQGFSETGKAAAIKDLDAIAKSANIPALPKDSHANVGSFIQGIFQGQLQLLSEEYKIAQANPGGSTSAQSIKNKFNNISNDGTTISIGGQSFTLSQSKTAAENPKAYYQTTSGYDDNGSPIVKLNQSGINGFYVDPAGKVKTEYSGNADSPYNTAKDQSGITNDLKAAGFSVKESNGQLYATQSSDGKNNFFKDATKGYGFDAGTGFLVVPTAGGYQLRAADSNGNQQLFNVAKDSSGNHFGVYAQGYDPTTKGQTYNLIGAFKNYKPLDNQLTATDSSLQSALGNAFTNYSNLPKYATENDIIPNIAKKFFNGDKNAAAQVVYDYRKSAVTPDGTHKTFTKQNGFDLGASAAASAIAKAKGLPPPPAPAPPIKTGLAPASAKPLQVAQTPVSRAPLPVVQARPQATLNVGQASSGNLTVQGAPNSAIQSGLQSAFANFSSRPLYYTENAIIPNIANQYYGGNKAAASTAVYAYRQQLLGKT